MDLTFFRRAEQRFASRTAAQLDFGVLVAMLRTQQAASPAARAQCAYRPAPRLAFPIVDLLLASPGWRAAVAAQRGSFNPAFSRQQSVN
jgi:hypothetical protein